MLEEACYAFAKRWILDELHKRHWTCAEQIELKKWRDELPALLPPAAIKNRDESLVRSLQDAVNIRNAATHRHICDNYELKKMSRQASALMAIFDDPTRENKFVLLWQAIQQWDDEVLELYVKQRKLEQALQEISERPIDDMDWSPVIAPTQEPAHSDEAYAFDEDDRMEMD